AFLIAYIVEFSRFITPFGVGSFSYYLYYNLDFFFFNYIEKVFFSQAINYLSFRRVSAVLSTEAQFHQHLNKQ
uniref:hypothetical protein n=1 Tax=Roseburia hominis TaxID=301301 RepID=UPI001F44560F